MFTRCTFFFFFFNNTLIQRATLGITQRERGESLCVCGAYQHIFARPRPPRPGGERVFACPVHAYQHIFARPHPPRPGGERERESLHVRCKHIGTHSHARIHLDQMQTGKQCVNTRDFLETNRPELRLAYFSSP